jgi:hypothetical protein
MFVEPIVTVSTTCCQQDRHPRSSRSTPWLPIGHGNRQYHCLPPRERLPPMRSTASNMSLSFWFRQWRFMHEAEM